MPVLDLQNSFPRTVLEPVEKKSEASTLYNCIGWAYDEPKKLWPNLNIHGYDWPTDVPNTPELDSFKKLFRKKKYVECGNGELEPGYLKIAIYTKDGKPKHAARQLPSGKWTSKFGMAEDGEHSIRALNGGEYGDVAVYMKRPNL
jgi:hypothetical protein